LWRRHALIGKILENGTKQELPDYARAVLFDRSGLGRLWRIGPNGERNFASASACGPASGAYRADALSRKARLAERRSSGRLA
jgi:hypothetical protein